MSWNLTLTVKPGDTGYKIAQEKWLYQNIEIIVKIYDTGRYCLEYGKYIMETKNDKELKVIDQYSDFFRNAAISMLNTSILEILKLLSPNKNDVYSLQRLIKRLIAGEYGTTNANPEVLTNLNTDLLKIDALYVEAKSIRDKVIAHTDPDGEAIFSIKVLDNLYENVLDILSILLKQLYNIGEIPCDYQANHVKGVLKALISSSTNI